MSGRLTGPRMLLAVGWGVVLLGATGALAFDLTPRLGQFPDTLHVAAHLVLFGVLAGLLARVGPAAAFLGAMSFGVAVEVVQVVGIGVMFPLEIVFDCFIDALGALVGIAVAGGEVGRTFVRNALHPGITLPSALFVTGVPPVWFGVALGIGLAGVVVRPGLPWAVGAPLVCSVAVYPVTPRGAFGYVMAAVLAGSLRTERGAGPVFAVAWTALCVRWSMG